MNARIRTRTALGRSDRVGLRALAIATAAATAAVLVVAVINVIRIATNTAADLTLPVDLPLPADAQAGTAAVVRGALTEATVIAAGLHGDTVALLAVGAALRWASVLCVAAAFLFVVISMLRDRPFGRALRNGLIGAGLAVAFLGMGGGFLTAIGTADAAAQLTGNGELQPYLLELDFDFAPLLIGLVLLTGALLVQLGERMQHDTERLV